MSRCAAGVTAGILVAMSGCVGSTPAGPARILTVHPTAPHRLFPDARASATDSMSCAPVGGPDETLEYQRVETNSRYLGALSLRLPPAYAVTSIPDRPVRVESAGGLLVAKWTSTDQGAPGGTRARGVSAWVGPEGGLPAVGAGYDTQQAGFAECDSAGPVRGARVAVFTLVAGVDTTAYVSAVWPLAGGRHLQLIASAARPAELGQVRRALLDARTESPARRD